jgi:CRP/FNR family transcriptional regulator, anaerobic regulatory protein
MLSHTCVVGNPAQGQAGADSAIRVQRHSMKLEAMKVACSSCNLRELCLPVGLSEEDLERVDQLVGSRRTLKRGEVLFRAGDRFESLYAVRTGFFKTRVSAEDGRDQVTGFQMAGELLGLDGISTDRHSCDAVALEDSQVCQIPYGRLEEVSREVIDLQHQFHKMMSREIVRDHGVMLLLGSMRAEARLAAFLLNLTQRLRARGFSGTSLVLRMTREEIGSYLGLKLETVSRAFSHFQDEGFLEVKQRDIRVLDETGLRHLLNEAPC